MISTIKRLWLWCSPTPDFSHKRNRPFCVAVDAPSSASIWGVHVLYVISLCFVAFVYARQLAAVVFFLGILFIWIGHVRALTRKVLCRALGFDGEFYVVVTERGRDVRIPLSVRNNIFICAFFVALSFEDTQGRSWSFVLHPLNMHRVDFHQLRRFLILG